MTKRLEMPTYGRLRSYALCGITAPPLFAILVGFASAIRPGYSQISNFVSDLGAGPNGMIQNLNFWAFGVLVILFAIGLGRGLRGSRSATISLGIFGGSTFLVGFFPDQPMPYPGQEHEVIAAVSFFSMVAAQFLLWNRLRHANDEEGRLWRRYRTYSLLSGLLSLVLLFVFGQTFYSPYAGLTERVFLVVPFVWVEAVAWKIFRLPDAPTHSS